MSHLLDCSGLPDSGGRASPLEKAITSPDWTGGKIYYQSGNV